jgi:hypothetical protein
MPDYYMSQFYKDSGAPTFGFAAAGCPAPDAIFIDLVCKEVTHSHF